MNKFERLIQALNDVFGVDNAQWPTFEVLSHSYDSQSRECKTILEFRFGMPPRNEGPNRSDDELYVSNLQSYAGKAAYEINERRIDLRRGLPLLLSERRLHDV